MDNLIQVVNRLQSACTALGDNAASDKSLPGLWSLLPTIVVIGGQVCFVVNTHWGHQKGTTTSSASLFVTTTVIWQVVGARSSRRP